MLRRTVPYALCAAGVALLALAAVEYWRALADESPVRVEDSEREIARCVVGKTIEVSFVFHNPKRHAVRVVGLAPC